MTCHNKSFMLSRESVIHEHISMLTLGSFDHIRVC